MTDAPPAAVLAAFGASGAAVPLAGGQGTAWRAGDVVVKPLDTTPALLAWQAGVLGRVDGHPEVRVSRPVRSDSGALVVAGWTAWRYQPGAHHARRWHDVIAAGRAFHRAVAGEPCPPDLATREDRWAVADRIAWDEAPVGRIGTPRHLPELLAARRPVGAVRQLVHGDLTGNVLFAEGLPPAVIDLAPYWRPVGFADAVVLADALAFEGAGPDVLSAYRGDPHLAQYLVRALIFRVVTDHLQRRGVARADSDDPYLTPVRLALELSS